MQLNKFPLDEAMISLIAKMAKERLDSLEGQRKEMLPSYQEKKTALQQLQTEFDRIKIFMTGIDDEIAIQQRIVEATERAMQKEPVQKSKETPAKNKATSKVTEKSAPKITGVNWVADSAEVLRQKGEFMTDKELYDALTTSEAFKNTVKSKKYDQPSNVRFAFLNTVMNHAKKVGEGTYKKANPVMIAYAGKIGLVEWMESGVPKKQYDWTLPENQRPAPLEPIEKVAWEKPKTRPRRPLDNKPVYKAARR